MLARQTRYNLLNRPGGRRSEAQSHRGADRKRAQGSENRIHFPKGTPAAASTAIMPPLVGVQALAYDKASGRCG